MSLIPFHRSRRRIRDARVFFVLLEETKRELTFAIRRSSFLISPSPSIRSSSKQNVRLPPAVVKTTHIVGSCMFTVDRIRGSYPPCTELLVRQLLARQRVSVYKINGPTLLGLNKFAIRQPDSAGCDEYSRVLEYPFHFLSFSIQHSGRRRLLFVGVTRRLHRQCSPYRRIRTAWKISTCLTALQVVSVQTRFLCKVPSWNRKESCRW